MARSGTTDRSLNRVRALCLALPEVREVPAWGHPNFRAGTKTFLSLERVTDRPSIAFRLPPVDVDLLRGRPGFFATPYGRGLWVSLWADGILDWRLVGDLVLRSYRTVALKRMLKAMDGRPQEQDQ